MKLFILASVATVSCIAVAACGSSSNKSSPSSPDGGEGGTSSGGEAGTGDGGSSSGGATPYVGEVTATKTGSTTPLYTLSATFAANPDASATTPTCAGTPSGSCCYIAASDGGAATDGGTSTVTLVSAGPITFTDGTTSLANVSPNTTTNAYGIASENNPSVKWTSGDTLKVSAAGATVNAFTGNLVTAADFADLNPALSSTATSVTSASGMTISWTAGTGTTVGVLIASAKDGDITCSVPDSSGTVSIASSLLQNFPSGTEAAVSVTRSNLSKSTDGNVTVSFLSTVTNSGLVKFE